MNSSHSKLQKLAAQIYPLLNLLYTEEVATQLVSQILQVLEDSLAPSTDEDFGKWNQNNVQIITYGGSLVQPDRHHCGAFSIGKWKILSNGCAVFQTAQRLQ